MQGLSDLPLSVESVPALSYPSQRAQRPASRDFTGDEEFPADLPGEYDRLLHPASGRGFRRSVSVIAALLMLFLSGSFIWGVYRFPKLTLAFGIALAIGVAAAACRVAFSVPFSVRSEPASLDLRRPTSIPSAEKS
jgi:hypothetical protein